MSIKIFTVPEDPRDNKSAFGSGKGLAPNRRQANYPNQVMIQCHSDQRLNVSLGLNELTTMFALDMAMGLAPNLRQAFVDISVPKWHVELNTSSPRYS